MGGDCGLVFMATCQLAHQQGHEYYYGRNMLFLPPRDMDHTLRFFYVLDPKHAALIRSLGLEIRLFDLTREIFENTIRDYTDSAGRLYKQPNWMQLTADLTGAVQSIWLDRIKLIRLCHGYTEVKIHFGSSAALLSSQHLENEMRIILRGNNVRSLDDRNEVLSEVLLDATKILRCMIYQRLSGGSLDAARDWISLEENRFN